MPARGPSIAILLLISLSMSAQGLLDLQGQLDGNTLLMQGNKATDALPEPVFQAVWRFTDPGRATFEMNRTTASDGSIPLGLDELLEEAIAVYLDAHVHFEKQGVRSDLPADRMIADLGGMVHAAAEEFGAGDRFHSFSPPTGEQLDRLTRIDWSQARFGIDGGDEQDRYLAIYYYVRSQRNELERQLRADLLPLAGLPVLEPEGWAGTRTRLNSLCGTVYDDQNYLCALDLGVEDVASVDPVLGASTIALLNARITEELEREEQEAMEQPRIRKRDRWLKTELDRINERIDRMDQRKELWAIRDRLDDVEGRLDDLQLQVDDVRDDRRESDNPIANLSTLTGRNLTVRFDRNQAGLDAEHRLLLNEVFEQLARNPQDKVLITGYADRSGNADLNLQLSEQRAKAVRNYLLQRGIEPDRLMVNYYGDSRSDGRDPSERRVEIEWIGG
ncbi:MAG: OmpA family protein [Flavobacteriales bacterium]|nr:OmpA family protein [Flavobacteriales bacterium]MCB0811734.1 OmpA family protein [Flavobacteriales bacterium]MCB9198990.1 OmpA family protein [Flavobacteriales bacterium]HPF67597.1 OmpA family protein [Flavobacteriales bacterium]HPJ53753.1 OmpA family protein [Flavobacteriales bacterium]